MKRIAEVAMACSIALVLAVPVLAHHSAAAYDTQKEIKMTGP
jgi:hypothetical protein